MQSAVASSSTLECLLDDVVLFELVIFDRLVDANNILPNNASSANVQMAHLRVAHEALGQSDGQRRGLELGVSVGAHGKLVHDGRLGGGNGIAILGALVRGDAPAINDDCKSARA